jgi:hypothetical protein
MNRYIIILNVLLMISGFSSAQVSNCQALKNASSAISPIYFSPENLRSDTMDVLKYTINLDITDFVGQKIKGHTIVTFTPKINGQSILKLDLICSKKFCENSFNFFSRINRLHWIST